MCGGACVYCFFRAHKCVTLSTTETESVTRADITKYVLFLLAGLALHAVRYRHVRFNKKSITAQISARRAAMQRNIMVVLP